MTGNQFDHLQSEAEKDALFREFRKQAETYQPEYQRILRGLSSWDQYALKSYISALLAQEQRISRTAYFLTPAEPEASDAADEE